MTMVDSFPSREADAEQRLAAHMWHAYAFNHLIQAPRLAFERCDLATAYRVQNLSMAHAAARGHRVAGYKVAMTSPAVQEQFALDHPTSGVLLDDRITRNGAIIPFEKAPQGRAEGEVAFYMGRDVRDPPAEAADMLVAIERALPAIEIVSSRIREWNISAFDFVADNAAAAYVVLGEPLINVNARDIAQIRMEMQINGKLQARGTGLDCFGSPIFALHWLALHLRTMGRGLRRGDLVMSGSLGPAMPVKAGDIVQVTFDGASPVSVKLGGEASIT